MNIIIYIPHTHTHTHTGVQAITELARQVDEAVPKVVEAAVALKRAPPEDLMAAKASLDSAWREWADKVQQLTAATDDIVDPEDFLAVSGEHVLPVISLSSVVFLTSISLHI